MKRLLPLLVLLGVLPVSGQFAQFPADATKFLSGANTWVVPGTFGAISATTITASGAQTNASTLGVAGATTLGSTLQVVGTTTAAAINATALSASTTLGVTGRSTLSGGLIRTPVTLAAASAVTNYGIDMALWSRGYKSMAADVTFTGITNNATGAEFEAILYNGSGGALTVRVPTGGLYSTANGVTDWSVDGGGRYLTVTNTWAVKVKAEGMGTASSNALWTATWFLP